MASVISMMSEPDGGPAERQRPRRRLGPLGGTIAAVFLVLLVTVLVGIVLLALDARTAYSSLRAAMPEVSRLQTQVLAGQADVAGATAEQLAEHTGTARDAVSGPHWTVAGALPWLGPNVDAVRTATAVVDDLATGVLPDLVAAAGVVNPARLAPVDGRIDLAPFTEAAPTVLAADTAVADAQERLAGIDTAAVHERLRGPLTELEGQLAEVGDLTETAARAVQLLPPMLGAEGPREYLLMVQNNAEPRSTGGLTGAFIHLRADGGAIELVDQGPARFLGSYTEPVVELSDVEVALFGDQIGRYPGNITATPDFPRSAEIAGEMWRQSHGTELDGVFSIDPVALASLLSATGPVELPTGVEISADDAAALMLNGVYLEIADPVRQDTFFQAAAGSIFSRMTSGAGDPVLAIGALAEAADGGRLMVWSAHREEQELLAPTVLSGELRGHSGLTPVIGVFLNDLSAAKIAYYQRMDVQVTSHACHPDGSQDLTVAVTLTSEVPDGAANLPPSLVGNGETVPPGDMRSNLLVYAPTGGVIREVRASDGDARPLPHVHDGLVVAARRVQLAPAASVTTEYDITTSAGTAGAIDLRMTPGPGSGRFTSMVSTCDESR